MCFTGVLESLLNIERTDLVPQANYRPNHT
jgi:hypothetical protein